MNSPQGSNFIALSVGQSVLQQTKIDYWVAGILIMSIFLLTVLPLALLPLPLTPASTLALCLHSVLALGLAFWLSEHILALAWSPVRVPMAGNGIPQSEVAVVMTICNDAIPIALSRFLELGKLDYDLFLLDDSDSPISLPQGAGNGCRVLHRGNRIGAKAGNLNNWLERFGDGYSFLCLLDSDSVMPSRTLDKLRRAAAHEANHDVAVFQSKLAEDLDHAPTLQSRLTGINARTRAFIWERVHARLGYFASVGHNQLIRISSLQAVGGFSERFGAEDTALSLALSSRGWRTALVNTWSYDREPASFLAYARRTIRWARQIVELFSGPWGTASFSLKLLLARALLGYLSPIFAVTLLLMSLWLGPSDMTSALRFVAHAWSISPGFEAVGRVLWLGSILVGLTFLLHYVVLRRTGDNTKPSTLILYWGHNLGMNIFLAMPLVAYMLMSALGKPAAFVPTNSRNHNSDHDNALFSGYLWCSGGILLTLLSLGAWFRQGSLAIGLTGVWTALILSSLFPFLWVYVQSERDILHNVHRA